MSRITCKSNLLSGDSCTPANVRHACDLCYLPTCDAHTVVTRSRIELCPRCYGLYVAAQKPTLAQLRRHYPEYADFKRSE